MNLNKNHKFNYKIHLYLINKIIIKLINDNKNKTLMKKKGIKIIMFSKKFNLKNNKLMFQILYQKRVI
jgi:hypothetical protein